MTSYQPPQDPNGFDPYRYGPPQPVAYTHPTGKQILAATWRLLKADRSMLVLPVLGAVGSILAFAVLFVPGLVIGVASGSQAPGWIFAVVGAFVASAVGMFFNAALVAGASMRADGYTPTVSSAMGVAARHWRQILGWTALTTTVGLAIRTIEQRLGIAGLILGFLGGVAWAIASFFVVPAIIVEGLGPVEALKRSSGVIREVWGTSVRTTLRFGALQILLVLAPFVVFFIGFGLVTSGSGGSQAVGGLLLVVAVLAFLAVAIVSGAVVTYARTAIFRYATGRPVPGIDPMLFAGAFRPRRRRRR